MKNKYNFLNLFIFFIFLINSNLVNAQYDDLLKEYNSLVSLFTKAGVLQYYSKNSTDQYIFCSGSSNTAITNVQCMASYYNFTTLIFIQCQNQNEILASDYVGNFRQLFFDSTYYIRLSLCTVEPGILTKFIPSNGKDRVYSISLDRCPNALVTTAGRMSFRQISVVLDTAINYELDFGQLVGEFQMSNYNNVYYAHNMTYTCTQTVLTSVVTLTIFASHYPPLNNFMDIGWFNLNLLPNYDLTSISNVLTYGGPVDYLQIREITSGAIRFAPVPPVDLFTNKTILRSIQFSGSFYTDRLLDYSKFTACTTLTFSMNSNYKNFSVPQISGPDKFPLIGLPPNLVTLTPGYYSMSGISGSFLSTADYDVFKIGGIHGYSLNAIKGTLPAWNKALPVQTLDLSYNQLTGTIDPSFCTIPTFRFNYNALTGAIPSCFKCYIQKKTGAITITGNSFTNNVFDEPCKSIIPKLLVNTTKSYLSGVDLGFSATYITSVPVATWTMVTPSYLFTTPTKFAAGTLVQITFSLIGRTFTLPVTPSAPVYDNVVTTTNEQIVFNGSYFTYNISDVTINLYDKTGIRYNCVVGDASFYSITCNITGFASIKTQTDVKTVITIGTYTDQISLNFGITNTPIILCSGANACTSSNSYCKSSIGSCICNYGFTGLPDCSNVYYDCPVANQKTCNNNGTCDTKIGSCLCNTGYSGADCTIKACSSNCLNGGSCDTTIGSCKCIGNYIGPDCSEIQCPIINSKVCNGVGSCDTKIGVCSCNNGYTGSDCSGKSCSSSCLNGGSCDTTIGECKCVGSYIGSDCSGKSCSSSCLNGGSCDTTIGSCNCVGNYIGSDCSGIQCPIINSKVCNSTGSCDTKIGVCNCNTGYSGADCSGKSCPSSCLNGGSCDTTIGSCKCVGNYIGSDCSRKSCQSNCINGGSCDTTIGECNCVGNYIGSDCSEIQCPITNLKVCNGVGSCDTKIGVCSCNNGYGGADCSEIKCPNDCSNQGNCDSAIGVCSCNNGYGGADCSEKTCSSNCLNGGSCDTTIGSCSCAGNYIGSDCSVIHIPCTETCTKKPGGNCDYQTGECVYQCTMKCLNQGTCNTDKGICDCPDEYTGDDCSIPNQWVSAIQGTTHSGGNITLSGWFGEQNDNLTVQIGSQQCTQPIIIDDYTINCTLLASDEKGTLLVNVTENGIIWIGKDLFQYDTTLIECFNNCSNNGVCLQSTGSCKCNDGWKGLDCNSPSISQITPPKVGSSTDDNGKLTIGDDFDNWEILITKLVEVDFNDNQVKQYILENNWKSVANQFSTISKFSQNLDNDAQIIYTVETIESEKDYSFSGLNYTLDKDSIKISILIENYKYSSVLNTLKLQMVSTAVENQENSDKCNKKSTEIQNQSNQLLNNIAIKRNNKIMYARFINRVISDGRDTFLQTSVISQDIQSSSVIVQMHLPHCKNCLIDPDFSVLLSTEFVDSCGEPDGRKSYVIPVAVVASVAGVAAIGASGFLVYRKKKVEFSQSKLKQKLNSIRNNN